MYLRQFTNKNQVIDIGFIKGKIPGTFFGDDFTTTRRVAILSSKLSQGLPIHKMNITFTGAARWYIPDSEGLNDGVCAFETGAESDSKCFVTSEPNRYQPQLVI